MGKLPSSLVPSIARGLPILLVDHDTTSLMCLASMLEQYSYKVTTTELATVALSMIWEQNDRFKLVMANINLQDIDSLQFLRLLITNNNVPPVILISSERSLSVAYKALVDGACFLMQKPICFDDLKYVWQLAYNKKKGNWRNETIKQECLKRMSTGKECEGITDIKVAASGNNTRKKSKPHQGINYQLSVNNSFKGNDKQAENEVSSIIVVDNYVPRMNNADTNTNTGEVFVVKGKRNEESNMNEHDKERTKEKRMKSNSELLADTSKNKEMAEEEEEEEEEAEEGENNQNLNNIIGGTITARKPRLVWTQELHLKFTEAISALGDKHVSPKAILELMNEPNLTQRQVASHLQKHRARMQRLCPNGTNISPPEVGNFSPYNSRNLSTGAGKNVYPNLPQEVLPDSTAATGLFNQNQQFPNLHQDLDVNQGFTYAISSQHQDQGFLNLHDNVLQQINLSPDSAVTGSRVHKNHFAAEKTLGQDCFPAHCTSRNVPNTGYSLSDNLTGIPEAEATPITAPLTFLEDQNQPLSQFAQLLKVLEEEGEPEPHLGDVDHYYESLRDALLGDNEPPPYYDRVQLLMQTSVPEMEGSSSKILPAVQEYTVY